MMINKKQLLSLGCVLILISIVLVTAGCGTKKSVQTTSVPKQVQEQKNVIEAAGKIKANDVKNIILDFPATVLTVHVKEGQRVKQGEELVTLDIRDIQQQIRNSENNLSQGRLQLDISTNDINTYENELQQKIVEYNNEKNNNVSVELKEKDYAYAQELLNRVKEDLARKQSLYEASAVSKSELDAEQRKYEDTEKAVNDKRLLLDDVLNSRQQVLDKLQTGINQQESKINDLRLNIKIQRQKLSMLESDINLLKDKLNKSYIRENKIISDVKNGMIQEIARVSGDYIQTNTKLLNLVNMDSLIVEAEVSEDFIKDVKVGAEVEILPLSDSSKVYKGRVLKIADMGIEKNGETFIITQISIDNADEYIKPNFNVDVKILK